MPISGSTPNKVFSRSVAGFTGSDAFQQLDVSGRAVLAVDADESANDLASGINAAFFKDGSNINADIPLNTNKFTGVENAAARDQFAAAGQVADGSLIYAATSSNDTITASLSPAITAYATGMLLVAKIGGTNTGASTINYNSVGAKSVKKGKAGSLDTSAGDLAAGRMALFAYDGTNMQLLNAPEFPSGTVMLFNQTSAPTGWTKDTTNDNNSAIRLVTGSVGTGGTVDFSTAFAAQTPSGTIGGTTLTTNQIPSHSHKMFVDAEGTAAATTSQQVTNRAGNSIGGSSSFNYYVAGSNSAADLGDTGDTGGGASHDHTFTGNAINLAVKRIDVIRATKD